MATSTQGSLDSAERLLKLRACLEPLSKNAKGDLSILDGERHECEEDGCTTLRTEHVLQLELSTNKPCDGDIGQLLDGKFVVRQLVSVMQNGSGAERGLHGGNFQWRASDLIVEGSIAGVTNAGTHRKPVFGDCQKCHQPGVMEGQLTGKVIRSRDESLLGCEVRSAYRLQFDPSEDFQSSSVTGTFEGLVVQACGKGDGTERGCLDFTTFPAGSHPNPWSIAGYEFSIFEWDGTPAPTADVLSWSHTGLNANYETKVTLPGPTSNVDITLVHYSSPATVRAISATGVVVDSATMTVGGTPETLSLSGPGIVALIVTPPQNETLILEICI